MAIKINQPQDRHHLRVKRFGLHEKILQGDTLLLGTIKILGVKPIILWTILVSGVSLVLVTFVLLFGLAVYGYYEFGQWIAPGTKIGNLDLGGMTAYEASLYLEQTWNQSGSIRVTNGIQEVKILPAEIGIKLDAEATSQKALQIGRSGTATFRIVEMAGGLFLDHRIDPVYSLDIEQANKGIETLVSSLSQPPKDASFQTAGGSLIISPSQPGYTINIEETLDQLKEETKQVINTRELSVSIKPVLPEIIDSSPFLPEAQKIIGQPASIDLYDPIQDKHTSIDIPTHEVIGWIQLSRINNQPGITLNETKIADYIRRLSTELSFSLSVQSDNDALKLAEALLHGVQPSMIIHHPPTTHRVQAGDSLLKIGWKSGIPYWMILEANPGIDGDRLTTGAVLTIPSKSDLLPLSPVPNKRILIYLKLQRLTVLQDGKPIKQFVISTGINKSPTQPGVFQIQSHVKNAYASVWDLYMPDFLGIYESWPGFMNGIHGLPTLSGGRRMWANSLGRPASYGCIILGLNEADWLYRWAENGVVVEIIE